MFIQGNCPEGKDSKCSGILQGKPFGPHILCGPFFILFKVVFGFIINLLILLIDHG